MDTLILTVLKSDILIYSQKMVTFVIKANVKSFKKKKKGNSEFLLLWCGCEETRDIAELHQIEKSLLSSSFHNTVLPLSANPPPFTSNKNRTFFWFSFVLKKPKINSSWQNPPVVL